MFSCIFIFHFSEIRTYHPLYLYIDHYYYNIFFYIDELIFYCPYKECTIAYPKMSIIASHIRSRHYAGLQTLKTTRAKDWIWRTASGRVIDFGKG